MVILRPTQKLVRQLASRGDVAAMSDTALGDWYVNRIVVDRQPLLLLVSSVSLLAVLEPAREVRELPERLPKVVARRLQGLGVSEHLVKAEVRAMSPVRVGATCDRSVVGTMVDFAKLVPAVLPAGVWAEVDLREVEEYLAHTPCRVSRRAGETVFPGRKSGDVLAARWISA